MAMISRQSVVVVAIVLAVISACGFGDVEGAPNASSCAAILCPVNTFCENGQCRPICKPGYADCNRKPLDGCEVYVDGDVENCGKCRNKCPDPKPYEFVNCVNGKCQYLDRCAAIKCATYPNSDTTCIKAQCQVKCYPGFANCDGVLQGNGCEVNLNTDPLNCGQCGHPCSAGMKCSNGVCA